MGEDSGDHMNVEFLKYDWLLIGINLKSIVYSCI